MIMFEKVRLSIFFHETEYVLHCFASEGKHMGRKKGGKNVNQNLRKW
jgi:hypothetical protein